MNGNANKKELHVVRIWNLLIQPVMIGYLVRMLLVTDESSYSSPPYS